MTDSREDKPRELYESVFDNTRVRLEDTKYGVIIMLDMLDKSGAPEAGTQVYLRQQEIAGIAAWLARSSCAPLMADEDLMLSQQRRIRELMATLQTAINMTDGPVQEMLIHVYEGFAPVPEYAPATSKDKP